MIVSGTPNPEMKLLAVITMTVISTQLVCAVHAAEALLILQGHLTPMNLRRRLQPSGSYLEYFLNSDMKLFILLKSVA
jgi:hypothetical protein